MTQRLLSGNVGQGIRPQIGPAGWSCLERRITASAGREKGENKMNGKKVCLSTEVPTASQVDTKYEMAKSPEQNNPME